MRSTITWHRTGSLPVGTYQAFPSPINLLSSPCGKVKTLCGVQHTSWMLRHGDHQDDAYLEQWSGAPRNAVSLIDWHGNLALTYAKVHTCDFDAVEAALSPGDDFSICPLETEQGTVKIGAMICYDREFPESARILMLKGAEIILVPNACHLNNHSLMQFRTRAYENVVGLAMTNYAAPENNGHSLALDGISEDEHGHSRDMLLVEAGESEGVFLATFDLNALRTYRLCHTGGNAFRRPHRYHLLTALDIKPPFVRVNAQGERYDPSRR